MRNIQIIQSPPRKTLCRCRVSYRSHRKTDNILGLADHTDPTPENISVCTNYRYSDPTLANVCEKRARSRMVHPGKHERVCKSELFTAYTREQGNTWRIICMCGKNNSIVSTPRIRRGTSSLPAAEIFSSAAETLELLPPTSAILTLMLCFSST